MKLKALSFAIAAATVLPQTTFAALPNGGVEPNTVASQYVLRLAGASAEDNLVFDTLLKEICASNITVLNKPTNQTVTKSDGTTGILPKLGNYFGVACKAKTTAQNSKIDSTISGQNILLLKRSEGGSAYGVQTLISNTPVAQIDPASCVADGTYVSPIVGTVDAVKCSNSGTASTAANVVPDAGVSDVDPPMFRGVNVPVGFTGVTTTSSSAAFGTVKSVVGQVFGVVVNTNLRDALQVAQGLKTGGASCKGLDTEACMPSMSKQLLASLFTGKVTQWNQIQVNGKPFTDAAVIPGITLPTPVVSSGSSFYPVKVCRRTPGSGTQAAINNVILDTPCNGGGLTPLTGNTSNVTQGSGSSDTSNCLKAWNTGTQQVIATDKSPGSVTVPSKAGDTGWAVGLMGLEKADANFKFIKIDGVAPSLKNAHDGKYPLWAEATVQWRTDLTPASKVGFAQTFKNLVGSASTLANLNSLLPAPAYMALSTVTGQTPDAVLKLTNPVIPYTRTTTNTDNCRVPSMNAAYNSKTPGF